MTSRCFHPAWLSPLHGISAGSSPLPLPCAESPAPWLHSDNSPAPFTPGQPQLAGNCHAGAGLWLCSQHLPQCWRGCLGLCSVEWRNPEVTLGWHQHLALDSACCDGLEPSLLAQSGAGCALAESPVWGTGSFVRGRCHDKLDLSRLLLGSAAPRCINIMRSIKGEGS